MPEPEDFSREGGIIVVNGTALRNTAYPCMAVDLWPTDVRKAKPEWVEAMNLYLTDFCRPVRSIADEIKCVACDSQVTGHHVLLTDWKNKEALTYSPHGTMEGRCTRCAYPMRMKHEIFSGDKTQLLVRLEGFPLFYYPPSLKKVQR